MINVLILFYLLTKNNKFLMRIAERLGINGVGEIKAHPFFFGINWKTIRQRKAPWIPEVISKIFHLTKN